MSTDKGKADQEANEEATSDANAGTAAKPEAKTDRPEAQAENLTPGQVQAALDEAQARADENWDKLLRAQAEMENIRKRALRDIENARKYALEGFASDLLPVRDSIEFGLDAIGKPDADLQSARDGMQLIQQMLAKLMEQHGIKAIDPTGEAFNPDLHQAMSMQESAEHAANSVIAVMQKGYTLNERLLRPAMVVVAKASTGNADSSEEKQPD